MRSAELASLTPEQFTQHQQAMVNSGYPQSAAETIISSAIYFVKQQPLRGYKKGENLFTQGQPAMTFFILRHGCVLFSESSKGKTYSQLATPITFLGDDVFAGREKYSHSAQALTDCMIQPVATANLRFLIRDNPALGTFFFINHGVQIDRQNARLRDFAFKDVLGKTACVLLEIIRVREKFPFDPLPQKVIGELQGSTRESVNKALTELGRRGIFSWERGSENPELADIEALNRVSNHPRNKV